jgi:hypothetical protein
MSFQRFGVDFNAPGDKQQWGWRGEAVHSGLVLPAARANW